MKEIVFADSKTEEVFCAIVYYFPFVRHRLNYLLSNGGGNGVAMY